MLKVDIQQQLGNLLLRASFMVKPGQVTALFGLSGAGKTALANVISGLMTPDEGVIRLNERTVFDKKNKINLPVEKRKIGYVFQEPRLFPHFTIRQNLQYAKKKVDQKRFNEIVELLGISHLIERYPTTLSGGEQQRVAIGRALLSEPELLLMDEPLAALDLPRKRELLDYLERLTQEINIPVLYVTHSIDELLRLAHQVVLMDKGEMQCTLPLEDFWQSEIFRPWQGESEKSVLYRLPVISHHREYRIMELKFGSQALWVHDIDKLDDNMMIRVCLYSSDISLVMSKPTDSSIRNILKGKIIETEELKQRVDLLIDIDGIHLWASISYWAFNALGLIVNQNIYAQIKSVSVLSATAVK